MFVKKLSMLYNFERVQPVKIVVIDIDTGQDPSRVNPRTCDFLGEVGWSSPSAVVPVAVVCVACARALWERT